MNSVLKKLTTKPSFFFLAYQGIMFLTTAVVAFFICWFYYNWDINKGLIDFFLLVPLTTAMLILYTLITHFVFKKNKNILFNPVFILVHVVIYGYLYTDFFINEIAISDATAIYILVSIPAIIIAFIFFTLIPYLIMLFIERKQNVIIENPPFNKNKLYLFTTLFAIIAYFLACIYSIAITVIMVLRAALGL